MTRDEHICSLWPTYSLTEIGKKAGVTRNVVAGVLRRADLLGSKGAYKRELEAERLPPRNGVNTGSHRRVGRSSYDEGALTETWEQRKARKAKEKR